MVRAFFKPVGAAEEVAVLGSIMLPLATTLLYFIQMQLDNN